MYKISIDDISKLRKITGSGIMNCKKALEKTKGNFNHAIKLLRKKGQEFLIKKQQNITNKGLVITKVCNNHKKGIIISLNSETDFAARNEKFIQLINKISELAIICNSKEELMLKKFYDGLSVQEKITELASIIKEKLVLTCFEQLEAPYISSYTHQNRIAALVGFSKYINCQEDIYKNVAMQVVAMNPIFLDEKSVDKSIIEKENFEEKNIKNNFFSEKVLINQPFIKNNNISLKEYITNINLNIKIINFKRVSI
ncbi:MAG: translation elongation factor Ts [Candidatus Bostrichicola ureolyticus]|nr:MAG: translation elongation factor Ts [Candidatus Bostrichicola ureolyticus]